MLRRVLLLASPLVGFIVGRLLTYILVGLLAANPADAITFAQFVALFGSTKSIAAADLNFAQGSSGVCKVKGAQVPCTSLVTFSGGVNGTVVNAAGNIVAASAPRFNYSATSIGAPLGLLIEEARTNLALQSRALATTPWSSTQVSGTTVTNNAGVSPDGTSNASSVSPTQQFGNTLQNITAAASTTYALSIYIKVLSGNTALSLTISDTIAGVVQSNDVHAIAATNQWARYAITHATGAGINGVNFTIQDRNASGFGTFLAWCAQVELGAFSTSCIPTAASSVTRSADVAQATGALLAALQGTAASVVVKTNGIGNLAGNFPTFLSETTTAVLYVNGAFTSLGSNSGGSLSAGGTTMAAIPSVQAAAWNATTKTSVLNGGTVASLTGSGFALTGNTYLGGVNGTGFFLDGSIGRVAVFNSQLPSAALQAMTTAGAF